jgi:hypothetical protein
MENQAIAPMTGMLPQAASGNVELLHRPKQLAIILPSKKLS